MNVERDCNLEYTILLNNGMKIPQIGFGCAQLQESEVENIIHTAIEAGYRYFDTATRYENEEAVGSGLHSSGIPREELFIVSKMWPIFFEDPVRAIEYSLSKMNMEYFDLYLLHWPSSSESRRNHAWETLLNYQSKGIFKSIGVSNFTAEQLEKLIDRFGYTPVMNQVELHPWYPQRALCNYCRSRQIAITAWSPLFRGQISNEPLLTEIGHKYGKTAAQITLRWHIQHNNIVIPKSSNPIRIVDNRHIFDFFLTEEDMRQIDNLEDGRHLSNDPNTNDGANFTKPSDF